MLPMRPEWKVVDERDERGALELYLAPPDFVVAVARGHFSQAFARRWVDVVDVEFKKGRVFRCFNDWEAMTTYDSGARRVLTTWILSNRKNVASSEFLVGSRIVAMGISTANVMTTLAGLDMVAHTDRAKFEAAFHAAARR